MVGEAEAAARASGGFVKGERGAARGYRGVVVVVVSVVARAKVVQP
ncbi:MAG: hypothetical protein AAF561_16060 [Planctomycetota bacterium]